MSGGAPVSRASTISIGHSITSWLERNSQGVSSPGGTRAWKAVSRGTAKPRVKSPSLTLGFSCATAIDGVGLR